MSKLNPLNGYLVLRPIEEDETLYGSIVIPDTGKEKPEMGEVIATSPTYNYHSDTFVPSNITVGDRVLIPKLGSLRITVESDEYFICKEQDVYSKIVPENPIAEVFKETEVEFNKEILQTITKEQNEL